MSFETAAKRMSADVLSFSAGSSSVNKGESLRDTVETVDAIGIDAVIVRHACSGVPARCPAGSTTHGGQRRRRLARAPHPGPAGPLHRSPGLRRGRCGTGPVQGLQVVIVGDIRHRRVARSQSPAYAAMGAEVTLVAPLDPAAAVPRGLAGGGAPPTSTPCCPKADVVSLLRVQSERGSGDFVPSFREYTAGFGLTSVGRPCCPDAVILHPGPMIRGVEIASDVADLPAAHHRPGEQRGGREDGRAVPALGQGPAELLGGSAQGSTESSTDNKIGSTGSNGR